ncbi:Aste57867_17877 [Aphanomyces stellatus]|uniref:Aste57867_17877 protein n=1 Tax=Aphanomyces stellatus TaxID=120398 RepID=A0A485L9B6_9STRA|nr:hypothetical protein As57867_017816 [Aphanomyces stellatus]VFT94620.1 Aste57867_17877 [Aphanomyces stellatus]
MVPRRRRGVSRAAIPSFAHGGRKFSRQSIPPLGVRSDGFHFHPNGRRPPAKTTRGPLLATFLRQALEFLSNMRPGACGEIVESTCTFLDIPPCEDVVDVTFHDCRPLDAWHALGDPWSDSLTELMLLG